jgi:hypothetical protein
MSSYTLSKLCDLIVIGPFSRSISLVSVPLALNTFKPRRDISFSPSKALGCALGGAGPDSQSISHIKIKRRFVWVVRGYCRLSLHRKLESHWNNIKPRLEKGPDPWPLLTEEAYR